MEKIINAHSLQRFVCTPESCWSASGLITSGYLSKAHRSFIVRGAFSFTGETVEASELRYRARAAVLRERHSEGKSSWRQAPIHDFCRLHASKVFRLDKTAKIHREDPLGTIQQIISVVLLVGIE
jgi:hypothetical protein